MISDPRHRAEHRQLWIDKVRNEIDKLCSPAEFDQTYDRNLRTQLLAFRTRTDPERLKALSPQSLAIECLNHDLADPLPDIALRALKSRGYPQRELIVADDWPPCEAPVSAAVSWCSVHILRSPDTQIMLLDDRTAKAVADSKNAPITAAELQQLPHNPCLIEFYRPIEIAENVKRGIRVRAVGFEAIRNAEFPAAVVCFYLDLWESVFNERDQISSDHLHLVWRLPYGAFRRCCPQSGWNREWFLCPISRI